MRAMVFDRYGEPDVMHLKDVPVPEPQDSEVIRVGYSGVSIQPTRTSDGNSRIFVHCDRSYALLHQAENTIPSRLHPTVRDSRIQPAA